MNALLTFLEFMHIVEIGKITLRDYKTMNICSYFHPRHPFSGFRMERFYKVYCYFAKTKMNEVRFNDGRNIFFCVHVAFFSLPFLFSFVYRADNFMQDDFQHIAITIRPRLISLCQSFFDRQELAFDAEDAVQETLLRLWQIRNRLDDYQHPEALAVRIAKNVCIDLLRQVAIRHETFNDELCALASTQSDHQAIVHDTERIVGHAMTKLSGTERRMLIMRSEGMTMKEIAATCGVTPDSAKTMICTARKQLMATLNIRRKRK